MLTIFGATGDLAQRMLLPSLYGLESDGLLPEAMRILGTVRSDLDAQGFRAMATESIHRREPGDERNGTTLRTLLLRIDYQPATLDDDASMQALGEKKIKTIRNAPGIHRLPSAEVDA